MNRRYTLSFVIPLLFGFICIVSGTPEYAVSVIGAFTVHELGHYLTAKALRVPLIRTDCSPLGIRMRFDFSGTSVMREILVYLGGPLIGIASAFLLILTGADDGEAVIEFVLASFTLATVNLLPIKGFDGGNVIEGILSTITLPDKAFVLSRNISRVSVLLFWVLTVYIEMRVDTNLSMLALAVYLIYSSF